MHRRHTTTTMSERFFDHGLSGINLHHAETTRQQHQAGTGSAGSRAGAIRQAVASLFIAAGTMLAGEEVRQPASTHLAPRSS